MATAVILLALTGLWLAMMAFGGGPLDRAILSSLFVGGDPRSVWIARHVGHFGSIATLLVVTLFAAVLLLARGRYLLAALPLLAIGVAHALSVFQRTAVGRTRPDVSTGGLHAGAFPSSHAVDSMAVYLLVALLWTRRGAERRLVIAAALLITFIDGVDRVVLGHHWPSDVIGGWAFGALLAVLFYRAAVIVERANVRPVLHSAAAADVPLSYVGHAATDYERVRAGQKWRAENEGAAQLLAHVTRGARVLDIPVGTGRLFPYFQARSFEIYGVDISSDMIEQARAKAEAIGCKVELEQADVRSLPYDDGFFDLVTCLRFLNLIDRETVENALRELARVSHNRLLIGIRYVTPLRDLRLSGSDLLRLVMRPLWIGRRLLRGRKSLVQDKRFVTDLLDRLGLLIAERCFVERRWDATDYVFFLLEKPLESQAAPTTR